MPCISVIIPLYNKEPYIERAVCSALSQSFKDFELIVVNDGSTDKGLEKVMTINDKRIKIIDQANSGVSVARNRGIEESRAELIAFLDADDEWAPDYLETIMRLVSKFPGASVFATNYFFCGRKKRIAVVRALPNTFTEGLLDNYYLVAAQSDPPLWTSAVIVRKAAIEAVGGFPVGVTIGEDLLMWARLAARYRIAYTSQPKACFWHPLIVDDRPGRVPAVPDIVGKGLWDLFDGADKGCPAGLKSYIALWHTMRASIYLQLPDSKSARAELQKAFHLNGLNMKWLFFFMLSLLPERAGKWLLVIRQKMQT